MSIGHQCQVRVDERHRRCTLRLLQSGRLDDARPAHQPLGNLRHTNPLACRRASLLSLAPVSIRACHPYERWSGAGPPAGSPQWMASRLGPDSNRTHALCRRGADPRRSPSRGVPGRVRTSGLCLRRAARFRCATGTWWERQDSNLQGANARRGYGPLGHQLPNAPLGCPTGLEPARTGATFRCLMPAGFGHSTRARARTWGLPGVGRTLSH